MFENTFRQQLILTFVDKAVLASVLVGVGYLANRKLEARKSRQALRAAMAEMQMPKIAEEIERISFTAASVERFLIVCWGEALTRLEDPPTKIDDADLVRLPSTQDSLATVLIEKAAMKSDIYDQLVKEWTNMKQQRFWLGYRLFRILDRRYIELIGLMVNPSESWGWVMRHRPSIPGGEGRGWWPRVRRWFWHQRDNRELRRMGLNTSFVETDVGRMVEHVSK